MDVETAEDCVDFLINYAHSASEAELKGCINVLRNTAITAGLNNTVILQLIDFLTTTDALGEDTKVFLLSHCLVPNELIKADCITHILNKLGTPTVFVPYKTVPPPRLQVALVKWVFHIYPWVEETHFFKTSFSIWFELWKLDYLQKWITYIIIWSFDETHITKWRCKVLLNVGNNVGYANSRTYATYILGAFASLDSPLQDTIHDYISILHGNEKRLHKLSQFEHDTELVSNIKTVFDRLGVIDSSLFEDIWAEFGNQCSFESKTDVNILTIEQLVDNWDRFSIPYDFTSVMTSKSNIIWIKLASYGQNDPRVKGLEEFLKRSRNCRKLMKSTPLLLIMFPELFHIRNLSSVNEQQQLLRNSDEIFEFQVSLCCTLFQTYNFENIGAQNSIHITISTTKLLGNLVQHQSEGLLVMCSILLKCWTKLLHYEKFIILHAFADLSLEQVLAINESLLTSDLCDFFVEAKDILTSKILNENQSTDFNKCISFLVGYLWNYNIIDSNYKLLPNEYWESLRSNQYLSHTSFPSKCLYSLPNFGIMSFVCHSLLFDKETTSKLTHYSNEFSEGGFKLWMKTLNKNIKWFTNVSRYSSFRKQLLLLLKEDHRYTGIAKFLFTYVKSLQE